MKNNFFKTLKVVIVLVAVCSIQIGCSSKYCEVIGPFGMGYWCGSVSSEEECASKPAERFGGGTWSLVDNCREKSMDDLENDYDVDIECETEKVESEE